MNDLTQAGTQLTNDLGNRYGLSPESVRQMLIAVNNGGGTMAQFSIPEFGSGQWMRGGMTMVGDMFNHGLQANVNSLCEELSNALANQQIFQPAPASQANGSGNWWPSELGNPSSSGGQNNSRYAIFPHVNRLAVQQNGVVKIFDTLDHQIGGVSQQQGSNDSLTFSSQFGTFSTLSLPLISGDPSPGNNSVSPNPAPIQNNQSNELSGDAFEKLRKLGELRDSGIITDDEFNSKKSELLQQI